MTAAEVLTTLSALGVRVELKSKSLLLKSEIDLTQEVIDIAKANKPAILKHLVYKCQHLQPFDDAIYSADPFGRTGWERVECSRCGRFIGYRQPDQGGKTK